MPLSSSMACRVLFFPFLTKASMEGKCSNPPKGHKVAALHGCQHVIRCITGKLINGSIGRQETIVLRDLFTCPADRQRSHASFILPAFIRVQESSKRDSSCFCWEKRQLLYCILHKSHSYVSIFQYKFVNLSYINLKKKGSKSHSCMCQTTRPMYDDNYYKRSGRRKENRIVQGTKSLLNMIH